MKGMMIVCGVVGLLVAGSLAYPTGAPSSVCDHPFLEPTFHRVNFSATAYNNTNQYTLHSEPLKDRPNVVRVTLTGEQFKGFVVRATTSGVNNLGRFINDENSDPFNEMTCSSQEDVAVTHVSPDYKQSVTLLYEDNNNGNYVFQATVVPNRDSYVMNIFENESSE